MSTRLLVFILSLAVLRSDAALEMSPREAPLHAPVAVEVRLAREHIVSQIQHLVWLIHAPFSDTRLPGWTANASSERPQAFPIWANRFTTARNPFRMTADQLLAAGGHVDSDSQILAFNWWQQGFPAETIARGTPFFNASNGTDPIYSLSCIAFSAAGCSAHRAKVHIPSNYTTEPGSDHHVVLYNSTTEYDMWGGDPNNNGELCALAQAGNTVKCAWGGTFKQGGKGLGYNGNEAQAGGASFGVSYISLGDLYSGVIRHALAINQECVDNPNRYPSDTTTTSGATCNSVGSLGVSPAPSYGQMIHLKMTPEQIVGSGASHYCQVILKAFATYGAYPEDVQNQAIMFKYEGSSGFGSADDPSNPWFPIFTSLAAGKDGSGTGSNFKMSSCFNRISGPELLEIIDDPYLGY